MKVRRLQQSIDETTWEDHGYVYERPDGSCAFSYNTLVWGRIGSRYNAQLQETGTKLEEVETIIPTGDQLRWLDIEEIDGDPEEIRVMLDEACQIPRPQKVSVTKPVAA